MLALGIVIVVCGAVCIAMGIFHHVYYRRSGWERTTAQIVGEYSYTERAMPKLSRGYRSRSNPVTYTQARILYNVNGKVYEKTLSTDETEQVDICYRKKAPDYFCDADWFEKNEGGTAFLIGGVLAGVLIMALGIAIILTV